MYAARGKGGKFSKTTDENAVTRAVMPDAVGQKFIPASKNLTFHVEGGIVPAERGAKSGKARGRTDWRNALEWALRNYRTNAVERAAALRAIALQVVDRAVWGDKDAVAEIANRLDGKPVQAMEVKSEEDRRITIVHKME
jgi:hypothetical protein